MRSRYKIRNAEAIYFLTPTTVDWINIFTSDKYFMILIDALRFRQENEGLLIHAYVIMKNHFHLIASHRNLSKVLPSYKKYTARKIIELFNSEGKNEILFQLRVCKPDYKTTSRHQFWQEGFHPKKIFSLKMLNQKFEYIHDNPVRKNYVENAVDWKYSSAIDYLTDKKGLIEITKVR